MTDGESRLARTLSTMAWGSLATLYLVHFAFIASYAVNVPYWDDWTALNSYALPKGLTLKWLFAQANEHRMVFTNLLTWILFKANGWDLRIQQFINFWLFSLLLVVLYHLKRRAARELPDYVFLPFLAVLLSTIAWENHSWAIQSHERLSVIFSLAACVFLFGSPSKWRVGAGIALGVAAVYSFGSGLLAGIALMALFPVFAPARARKALTVVVVLVLGGAIGAWFIGLVRPASHPPLVMPWQGRFWGFVTSLVSFGFGYSTTSLFVGLVAAGAVVAPLIGTVRRYGRKIPEDLAPALAASLTLLAIAAGTAFGRASEGSLTAKQSRYSELVIGLVPLTLILWYRVLSNRRPWMVAAVAGLALLTGIGYHDRWNFAAVYEPVFEKRIRGWACLRDVLQNQAEGMCPDLYYAGLAEKARAAQELNLSFVRPGVLKALAGETMFVRVPGPVSVPQGDLERVDLTGGWLSAAGWVRTRGRKAPPVRNFLSEPDKLAMPPWWSEATAAVAIKEGIPDPDGGHSAARWEFRGATKGFLARSAVHDLTPGERLGVAIWCRAATERPAKVRIDAARVGGPGYGDGHTEAVVTGVWQRLRAEYRVAGPGRGGTPVMVVAAPDGDTAIDVYHPELSIVPESREEPLEAEETTITIYVDGVPVGRAHPGGVVAVAGIHGDDAAAWGGAWRVQVEPGDHEVFAVLRNALGGTFVTPAGRVTAR